jgi:hypothetical protein
MRNFPAQYTLQANDVLYFCHIPKTAGMTFRTIVEDQFYCHDVCPATLNAHLAKMPVEELQHYRLYRGHLGFMNLPALLPEKRVINVTVLREPVARVISHYDYILRMPGDPHYPAVKNMSLEEFAQKLTAGKVGKNIQTYHVAKTTKFSLDDLSPNETLDLALDSLDDFAFVGLVERFQDSLFLLSYIFGWKPILNTRKENASAKKAKAEIPEQTLQVIRDNTQLDDVLYRHAKAIFEERFAAMQHDLLSRYGAEVLPGVEVNSTQLSDTQITALLEKHADQRYRELQPKPPQTAIYDFCQPLRGTGWQRREYHAEDPLPYRWIGPGTEATLDLAVATDADLYLEFQMTCTMATASEVVSSLSLQVNQKPLPYSILYGDRGMRIVQALVPKEVLQSERPFTQIAAQISYTIRPNALDPKNVDKRQVGVAVNLVQLFPPHLETKCSAAILLFDSPPWKQVLDFLQQHSQPEEAMAAPLAFKVRLPNSIADYKAFLEKDSFSWLVVHKGMIESIDPMMPKLLRQGFVPVYANEVFVILTTRRDLPTANYLARHVRSLYTTYMKRTLAKTVKPIRLHFQRRAEAKKLEAKK